MDRGPGVWWWEGGQGCRAREDNGRVARTREKREESDGIGGGRPRGDVEGKVMGVRGEVGGPGEVMAKAGR